MTEQEMANIRRLQEILHKTDIEVETVVTSVSIGKALRLCERYDIRSVPIQGAAYRYFLCKALRRTLFAPGSHEPADQADIVELPRIQEYFRNQLQEMLNKK